MASVSDYHMLTTKDNPYDPFSQYEQWLSWDTMMGYDTPGLLARYVKSSHELSELEQGLIIEQAIEEIVTDNYSGVHKRVTKQNN